MKTSMFNEHEAILPEVSSRFYSIDQEIRAFVKNMSQEYRTVEIEQHLSLIITNVCGEQRLRNAVDNRLTCGLPKDGEVDW